MSPSKNTRKSPRADFINYDFGWFFITICTHNMRHYFGEIVKGRMYFSRIGEFANSQLAKAIRFNDIIEVKEWVVMPNHVHAIVSASNREEFLNSESNPNPARRQAPGEKRHITALAKFVNSFKGSITKYANSIGAEFKWQTRYNDHRIRGFEDNENIRQYIRNNVSNWHRDCFNPPEHPPVK